LGAGPVGSAAFFLSLLARGGFFSAFSAFSAGAASFSSSFAMICSLALSAHAGAGELGSGLHGDAGLLIAVDHRLDPRAAAVGALLLVVQRHVRDVDRAFLVDDPPVGVLLRRAAVALDHRDLLDDHAIADDAQDLAALALVGPADHDHYVALAYVRHG